MFEYTYYKDFIEKNGDYKNPPLLFIRPFLAFLTGFFVIGLHQALMSLGFDPENGATTEFMAYSFAYKMLFSHLACFSIRLKYYVMFRFQTATLMACGISFSGRDEQERPEYK